MPSAKTSYFVDTNVIVYAVDPGAPEKRRLVVDLLSRMIRNRALVLSPQSLNEFYRVVTDRKRLLSREDAREFVFGLSPSCTAPLSYQVTQKAWQIQDAAGYAFWDCMLLASASLARCNVFVSEDMLHGQKLGDLIIMSPFESDFASHFSF
jgi:predicted nucleic acid-binding protein